MLCWIATAALAGDAAPQQRESGAESTRVRSLDLEAQTALDEGLLLFLGEFDAELDPVEVQAMEQMGAKAEEFEDE